MARVTERRRIRILVVEDNELDVALVRKLLDDHPQLVCEWDWARSCAEALEKFGNNVQADVCLLDYHLEDGKGLDLVKEAVALGCRFPIVFLTGEEDMKLAVEAIKAGASNYLVKRSLSRETLVSAIKDALPVAGTGKEAREGVQVANALPGGTTLNEYRFDRVLGHGGFGITYLAWDSNLDKTVAIKEYLPDELAVRSSNSGVSARTPNHQESFQWGLQQFVKEAKALARFSHPNLIRVLRYFEANGTAYIVTEYIKGESFAALLKREPLLPEHRLRAVLLPVLGAVEEVHRAGILHRDIKPANILLQMDGAPVLIDFGAARTDLGTKTRSVIAVFSTGYAPPEQYSAGGNQGPWTDIYALAAVAYTALSGRRPIEAINRLQDDPLVPAELAGRDRYASTFLKAVDWGLSVRAEERPRSVAEWRSAFGDSARGGAGPSRLAATPTPVLSPTPAPVVEAATQLHPPAVSPATASVPPAAKRPYATRAWIASVVVIVSAALYFKIWKQQEPAVATAPVVAPAPAQAPPERIPTAAQKPATSTAAAPKPSPPAPAPAKPAAPAVAAPKPSVETARAPAPARLPVVQMTPLSTFQDCPDCPAMIVMPTGTFAMGTSSGSATKPWEGPVRNVTLKRFALGRFEVTSAQWQECVRAGSCTTKGAGSAASLPVVNVTWNDASAYAAWLSASTGRKYRLPSESEWEFATRGGTKTPWFWGSSGQDQCSFANGADPSVRSQVAASTILAPCTDGYATLAAAGSFRPNRLGLHDLAGNVWEWTLDCWKDTYAAAPTDGTPVTSAGCTGHVMRGGGWRSPPEHLRSAARGRGGPKHAGDTLGFRVAAD